MKRYGIFFMALMVCVLFFSCQKKANAPVRDAEESAENVEISAAPAANAANEGKTGYALRVNASFYTLESNTGSETDKTKWAASMALGERVSVGQNRKATFSGDSKVYDFIEIRRDNGSEGLAFASQIAEGSLAVVVDEKANLYKSPKTIDVTGTVLPRKTMLVYSPASERDGFVEIRAYDSAAQAYRQSFIRLASVSTSDVNIQSSILLQTALALKDEGAEKIRKDALLEAALLDYPASVFNAEIQALVNPNAAAAIQIESISAFMQVIDDNVNVRDLPDSVAGKIIGKLDNETKVTVSGQTASFFTIGRENARWYRITAPLEGWVFGTYLE